MQLRCSIVGVDRTAGNNPFHMTPGVRTSSANLSSCLSFFCAY